MTITTPLSWRICHPVAKIDIGYLGTYFNNNNVRLLNSWHSAQLTVLTSATQGSTIYRKVKPAKLLPHTAHSDWINRTGLTSWACTDKVAHYSIYRPRKDERLSWPSLLTYSGRLTHISGHPSARGRAWDRKSSPVKDRRSTNCATQPTWCTNIEVLHYSTPTKYYVHYYASICIIHIILHNGTVSGCKSVNRFSTYKK